jgi:hypothetical protein
MVAALALLANIVIAQPRAAAATAAAAVDYADPSHWICRPERDDVCSKPLTSTVLPPDGTTSRKTYAPDPLAPVDCFYVYPTVSQEPTANADMSAGPAEQRAVTEQFARFGSVCRTYAPLYRQTTIAAMHGEAAGADRELAYGDVLAAWRFYLAHDNRGRGVVLIGHSQGAHHLARLIAEEIDGKSAQRLLISAILLGGDIETQAGADSGGTFRRVSLCRRATQSGCVIAYSSFLAENPPGPDSPFGGAHQPGRTVACVNPAELLGHDFLTPELLATPRVASVLGTVLVENPDTVSAECRSTEGRNYLALSVRQEGIAAPILARSLVELDSRGPHWGLHPLDVSLSLGDLVEIVSQQSIAWRADDERHRH